jgi:hypothetical protein
MANQPRLFAATAQRLKQIGLDPNDMSAEQLAALESIEKPDKSHWLAKPFLFTGAFLGLASVISIFRADWDSVVGFGIVSFVLLYIGRQIQVRIAARRFVKATIKKAIAAKQNEPEDRWKGMKNTDEVLSEKAAFFAGVLIQVSRIFTRSLFEELEKKEVERLADRGGEVFIEMVLFGLHFTDRIAYQCLASDDRCTFMDALFLEVREYLSRIHETGVRAEAFRSGFQEAYKARQLEYSQFKKMFADEGEGTRDTLFWEFGRKLSDIFDNNPMTHIMAASLASTTLVSLKLPELLGDA